MIRQLLPEPRHFPVRSLEAIFFGETRQSLIEHTFEQNAAAIVRPALTLCRSWEILRNRLSAGLHIWFGEQYDARGGIMQDVTFDALPLHRSIYMWEWRRTDSSLEVCKAAYVSTYLSIYMFSVYSTLDYLSMSAMHGDLRLASCASSVYDTSWIGTAHTAESQGKAVACSTTSV